LGDHFFVGGSHAYLQVPGEIVLDPRKPASRFRRLPHVFNQPPCVPPIFNQFPLCWVTAAPARRGGAPRPTLAFDREFNLVQYSAAQTAYNWDCCGISLNIGGALPWVP